MTINPSQAEGLEVCSEEQLAHETSQSEFGAGCPAASKIGTIEVETPLLPEELFKGTLFVAEPYRNPFGTLIALYVVIKDPELGVKIVQPLKVVPDPVTGQLVTYCRRNAPAALLPLPPALPRRRPGAADHPAGLRGIRPRRRPCTPTRAAPRSSRARASS